MADFADRRVAILGTGREGRAAWRYLRGRYPEMALTLIDESAPDPSIADALTRYDTVVTGPLSDAGLEGFDLLVRSPGISVYRDCLRRAMAAGVSQATVPTMAGMVGALSGVLLVTILSRRAAHEVQFLEDSLTMDH